jgi:hypothetical protein
MAACGDASSSPHLSLPTALPELKAREGGDFREGLPEPRGGFRGRGGGGCAPSALHLLLHAGGLFALLTAHPMLFLAMYAPSNQP